MNDLGIKGSPIKDSASQGPNGRDGATALAGLAGSFQDLVGKAGFRLEDGFSALIERTGISAAVERPEPANRPDDYRRDNADDRRDRFDNGVRGNDAGEDRSDTNRVEKYDDYGRDSGADNRDDHSDGAARDDAADPRDDGDRQARDEGDGKEDRPDDSQASGDDGQEDDGDGQSAEAGDDSDAEGNGTNDENDTAGSGDSGQTATGPGVATEAENAVLAGLVAGGNALSADGKASEQGKVSSQDGIARATSNISNAGPEKAAAQGTENMSQTAVENTSKTTPSASGRNKGGQENHQSQGQANASAQAKGVANEAAAIIAGTDGEEGANAIGVQAAGLAKAIGDGNRTQVTVTVNNESQNLTSKPGQVLSANAVLSTESASQQANSQNANTHAQGNSQNPTAQAQAQLASAVQAQNQGTQNAANQVAQAGGDAKGLALASTASSGSGSAHAGGGEGSAQAGGSTATQQTQSQSAANQTGSTQKTFRPGHSMVEQISVKITKAIQAGNDKIIIQLRPANMGRIEVKMELSPDNRLTAIIIADNRDTLEQLKNDSRSLQRALEDAGIQTDAGDLEFNLRGQEGQDHDNKGSSGGLSFDDEDLAALETEIIDQPVIATDGTIISNGRIDVRA